MNQQTKSLVLELGNGKFWVARTANADSYVAHIENGTCTTKYILDNNFISVIGISPQPWDEVFFSVMKKQGKDNVRGTSFTKQEISKKASKTIDKGLESDYSHVILEEFEADEDMKLLMTHSNSLVYVLKLEGDKFFVDCCTSEEFKVRASNSFKDLQNEWLAKYAPIKCIHKEPKKPYYEISSVANYIESLRGFGSVQYRM